MTLGFFVVTGSQRPLEIAAFGSQYTLAFVREAPAPEEMIAMMRTPLDVLWVDLAVLPDSRPLRQIRVMRPETRIVIGYDPDLGPPHPLMAQVVALGIYDLVPSDRPLPTALDRHATYADVARWQQADASARESVPSGGVAPFLAPASRRRTLWRAHLAEGPEEAKRSTAAVRIVHPRRLLVLGGQGGVGTSSVVVTLAQAWQRDGLPVAVVDAARQGGWLPLAWDGAPVDQGWEAGIKPGAAWRRLGPDLYLLAQSGMARSLPPAPEQADRLLTALRHGPHAAGSAWLIDGGTDAGWSGVLGEFVDGILLVITPDPVGLYAGARMHAILAAGPVPVVGLIANRWRAGQPRGRDVAAAWAMPCLADWPDHADSWDPIWAGRPAPGAHALMQSVAHRLVDDRALFPTTTY